VGSFPRYPQSYPQRERGIVKNLAVNLCSLTKGGEGQMLVGQYDYAIDAKGRLNFPAKFRDGMGETFIVTRWLDHCLAAFPPEEFEKVAQRIAEKGMVKGRNVSRMLYSSAVEVTPDKQGRIQLPAKLREYANLDHDVSVIGNRNFAEIWNTQDWEARQAGSRGTCPHLVVYDPRPLAVHPDVREPLEECGLLHSPLPRGYHRHRHKPV